MFKVNTNQKDSSNPHYSGWNWIIDSIMYLNDPDSDLFLDMYTDNTFYGPDQPIYKKDWVGFIHHTLETSFSDNNCNNLIQNENFLKSLESCKGLIVMSKYLQEQLQQANLNVEVYYIFHPTKIERVPEFSYVNFLNNSNKKVLHIGGWLRNSYSFYELDVKSEFPFSLNFCCKVKDTISKVALDSHTLFGNNIIDINININIDFDIFFNKHSHGNLHSRHFHSHSHSHSDSSIIKTDPINKNLQNLKDSVKVIPRVSNEEYDDLLSQNIVFLNLVDASAINTLLECVVRNTPIIINKIPAVVEVLGENYPLYYTFDNVHSYYHMNSQINTLLNNKNSIYKAYKYLKKMDKTSFKIETFQKDLVNIIQNLK
jgi:hypothetical protein